MPPDWSEYEPPRKPQLNIAPKSTPRRRFPPSFLPPPLSRRGNSAQTITEGSGGGPTLTWEGGRGRGVIPEVDRPTDRPTRRREER